MFSSAECFLAAVFYGVTSSSMAFLNKELLSAYAFKYPFSLLTVQMLVGLLSVEVIRAMRTTDLAPYTVSKGLSFWLPSLCCALHSVVSLLALEGMNIPMYAAIKRCTPFVNLMLSVHVLRKPLPSKIIVFSVVLITVGCLIAGFGDLSFRATAYVFGILSVFVQGTYQTLIQKAAENNQTTLEIFYLNCYNCLVFFLVGSIITLEFKQVYHYPYLTLPSFLVCFFMVTSVGALLNYSLFLCTSLNTALTTSIVGVIKSIIQTILGFFTFGGVAYHPLNILGLSLNTGGGFLYAYGKLKEKKPNISSISFQKV